MCGNCVFGRQIYCWFCSFYSIIVSLMLVLCISWTITLPHELRFHVTDAWFEEFELVNAATNYTLTYNLALNITIRNPNKRVGVYFDRVQVNAKYRKKSFALLTLGSTTSFYKGCRNNITLHAVLKGRQTVTFGQRDLEQYRSETSARVYSIDVKLALVVRTKCGKVKSGQFKPPKIECNKLKVPLRNYREKISFKARPCKNVFVLFNPDFDDHLTL